MEELKEAYKTLEKSIKTISKSQAELLAKVREQSPEEVDELIADNKKIFKAIRNRDTDALLKMQKKYANTTD